MASETKSENIGNVHTGLLEIKIRLDTNNVIKIQTQHVRECFFVEDIFKTCMTGKIKFVDNYGLYEYGPFTGNETVSIRYGRNKTREVVFHILKVEKISPTALTSSQVSPLVFLEIADTSFELFTSYRYSRSYESKQKHTNIAKHIIKHQVGWTQKVNEHPSTSETNEPFCIPYWTPKQSIDYILSHAYSGDDGGYLCYMNTKNRQSVNIYPLSWLLSKNNYTDKDKYDLEVSDQTDDPKRLKNKILEWWIDGLDHTMTKTIRNTKWYGYDITKKKMFSNIFDYTDGIKYNPIMGNYSLFENGYHLGGNADTNDGTFSHINTTSGEESVINLKKFAIGDFLKKYNMHQLVNVIVSGNEKRYAGHQIMINWNSVNQEQKTKNRLFDGAYLVKAISHSFIQQESGIGYIQRMILIKNGFQTPNTNLLEKARITNLAGGKKTSEFEDVKS